jgi:sulfatase modifying factor 1
VAANPLRNLTRTHQIALLMAGALVAMCCDSHPNVQCEMMSDCNLHFGGTCTTAPTGNQWCAYPDPACPTGMRYSDQQVGDGVSGQCTTNVADGGVDGLPAIPASCVALPHTCGATGNDDCCNSPTVVGDTYSRSFDVAGDGSSGNTNAPATVSNFKLDKYEATVGRFRAFVAANQGTQLNPPATGAGANPYVAGSGWESGWNQFLPANPAALLSSLKCNVSSLAPTWTDSPGANEDLPINCLNWYMAMAFCAWDGGFLPTEAEWNYAAAGGKDQRPYPWSSGGTTTLDPSYASYNCIEDGTPSCALKDILAVGTLPQGDGRWGQADLAGNVAEWTLDWAEPYVTPCTDCAFLGAHPSGERELRGGSWTTSLLTQLRTGTRASAPPEENGADRGVRCARAP